MRWAILASVATLGIPVSDVLSVGSETLHCSIGTEALHSSIASDCVKGSSQVQALHEKDFTSVLQVSVSVDRERGRIVSAGSTVVGASRTSTATSHFAGSPPVKPEAAIPQDLPMPTNAVALPIDGESVVDTEQDSKAAATTAKQQAIAAVMATSPVEETFPSESGVEVLAGSARRVFTSFRTGVQRMLTKVHAQIQSGAGSSFMPWALGLVLIICVICGVMYMQLRSERQPHNQSSAMGVPGLRRPTPQEQRNLQSQRARAGGVDLPRPGLGQPQSSLQAMPSRYSAGHSAITLRPYSPSVATGPNSPSPAGGFAGLPYDSYGPRQGATFNWRDIPDALQAERIPPPLLEVERTTICATPRGTPAFFEGASLKQTLMNLPRLSTFSTGELPGPFEIDLRPLFDSRKRQTENTTPILGRSSQRSGATCTVAKNIPTSRANVCTCGNILSALGETEFCRKCGNPREDAQVLVVKYGGNKIVTCGPVDRESTGSKKAMQVRGADHRLWGMLKSFGRDKDDVYWYTADPEYKDSGSTKRPAIYIGHVDDGRETFKVCLWDPVSEGLPRGNPPGIHRANELRLAEAFSVGDAFEVHLAPCSDEGWLKVLVLSLVLSVKVFSELKAGLQARHDDEDNER